MKLRCLFHDPEFQRQVLLGRSMTLLACHLNKMLRTMLAGNQPDTQEFASILVSLMPTPDHSQTQQDIDEFLKVLIDKSLPQLPSHNYCVKPGLTCLECGDFHYGPKESHNSCIMNPCGESIKQGLKAAFANETLDEVLCTKCQKPCPFKKQHNPDFSGTEVCTVFIKRAKAEHDKHGTLTLSKDSTNIRIARNLELDDFHNVHLNPSAQRNKVELFAFINHEGNEVSCYFCDLKYMCSF